MPAGHPRAPGRLARVGLMKRVSLVFQAKANKALDRIEDPRETLDYSYERQLEMLQKVRRSLVDVAAARKRLEMQGRALQDKATKLFEQGRRAVALGRDDLAREALSRRAAIEPDLNGLKTQHDQLTAEEARLTEAARRLSAQVEAFRTRKETIKATYTAAEARTSVNEAVSGISEEMGDVGLTMQRAEDRTGALQARAGAIDELLASGALDDLSKSSDYLDSDLSRAVAASQVDAELARLKAELPAAPTAAEDADHQR
jgi:phage shock protein A